MHIASHHHINIMHHHNKDTSSYISSSHHCMCTLCIFNIQCASLSYLSSACLDYTPELHQHCWSINISLHALLSACLGSVHARKKLRTVYTRAGKHFKQQSSLWKIGFAVLTPHSSAIAAIKVQDCFNGGCHQVSIDDSTKKGL